MRRPTRFFRFLALAIVLGIGIPAALRAADVPRKLLVVTITTGYRHGSIAALEKMLQELSASSGEFTVDFVRQPDGMPPNPGKDATPDDKAAFDTAKAAWMEKVQAALEKLSPASLQEYDGVVFASTTGDLPIPDKPGFLEWIKAGHAFIGLHAASDTFHHWPEYIDMLGGEFREHGPQVGVDCLNQDPANPATAPLPKVWTIAQEEIYQFKNYDPQKVHELLVMDVHPNTKAPGHFPVSWCKNYGAGRVFYTSLAHRDDMISPDPGIKDRKNPVETATGYRAHVLGGIEWALGLKGDATVFPSPAASPAPSASATPTGPGETAPAMPSPVPSGPLRPLLDNKLSAWEVWLGVPHKTVTDLSPGTLVSEDGHAGTPLGLNNDPKHVFSVSTVSGEPVLCITGEIFGALTTLETFSNYHLHAEFRWGERKWEPKLGSDRDNGLLFHCTGPHGAMWNAWKRSFEFEVQEKNTGDIHCLAGTTGMVSVSKDSGSWRYDPAGEMKRIGSGRDSIGNGAAHLAGSFENPTGQWNTLDLYALGQDAVLVVNGRIVQVMRQAQADDKPLLAGQIQLQSEGAETYYRRLGIEPIQEFPPEIRQIAGL